jgi:hypothetical protein
MATSSITTNIVITGEKECMDFINALEESERAIPKKVEFARPVVTLTGKDIDEFFSIKRDSVDAK